MPATRCIQRRRVTARLHRNRNPAAFPPAARRAPKLPAPLAPHSLLGCAYPTRMRRPSRFVPSSATAWSSPASSLHTHKHTCAQVSQPAKQPPRLPCLLMHAYTNTGKGCKPTRSQHTRNAQPASLPPATARAPPTPDSTHWKCTCANPFGLPVSLSVCKRTLVTPQGSNKRDRALSSAS